MAKDKWFVNEDRDLSKKEISLIEWLLEATGHSELKKQIDKTRVVSKCGCGCPTVDLKVAGYEKMPIRIMFLSAKGISPEGVSVGVILHVRNGLLSELEIYSQDGTESFGLPEIDTLQV